MTLGDLAPLALPLATIVAAVVVLLVDVVLPPERGRVTGYVTVALLALLLAGSFLVEIEGAVHHAYVANAWSLFVQRLGLGAALLATLGGLAHLERTAARRQGEHHVLLLLTTTGLVLLPGARDVILLVVAFELMGLPLTVLAAYAKTDGQREGARSPAAEAALKLYLTGAASTAITLFGLSLVVGLAGTTQLEELLAAERSALFSIGWLLVLGGLAFKIGVPPFHMWIPDTYQGAPVPFVAYLSVAPKAGGVAVVAGLATLAVPDGEWTLALLVLAVVGMTVGNLMALPQKDVRRLLGYSGIAQMGYVLVAVALGETGTAMALFYLAAYLFANVGLFLVVHAASNDTGGYAKMDLAGLVRRSPALGLALLVFLLSLAGIPFAVGFWAKLYVFLAAYRAGLAAVVAAGALFAVVALFYYLQIARAAYMEEPPAGAPSIRVGGPMSTAIAACLVAVLAFGLWPRPLLDAATRAAGALHGPSGDRGSAPAEVDLDEVLAQHVLGEDLALFVLDVREHSRERRSRPRGRLEGILEPVGRGERLDQRRVLGRMPLVHELFAPCAPGVDGGQHFSQQLFLALVVRPQRVVEQAHGRAERLEVAPTGAEQSLHLLVDGLRELAQPHVVCQQLLSDLVECHRVILPPELILRRSSSGDHRAAVPGVLVARVS